MGYYKECAELDRCHELDVYWETKEFEKWTKGYIEIADETEYPLGFTRHTDLHFSDARQWQDCCKKSPFADHHDFKKELRRSRSPFSLIRDYLYRPTVSLSSLRFSRGSFSISSIS